MNSPFWMSCFNVLLTNEALVQNNEFQCAFI
jgi:hypothetical protein